MKKPGPKVEAFPTLQSTCFGDTIVPRLYDEQWRATITFRQFHLEDGFC